MRERWCSSLLYTTLEKSEISQTFYVVSNVLWRLCLFLRIFLSNYAPLFCAHWFLQRRWDPFPFMKWRNYSITFGLSALIAFVSVSLKMLLMNCREIFDEKAAKREGTITPKPGVNQEYDQGKANLEDLTHQLESHLRDLKKETGITSLVFWGSGKDRYQIEVPMNLVNKVPREWTSKSQKKSHRRYWTPSIEVCFYRVFLRLLAISLWRSAYLKSFKKPSHELLPRKKTPSEAYSNDLMAKVLYGSKP